jgi:hypothetical protein
VDGLLTPQELAQYLKVKVRTLDNWACQHKGPPFIQVEGVRRYEMDEVRNWVEERKVRH